MLGAIIGDIIGSKYEWNNIHTKEFPLFSKDCFFTDDTILTIAAADWMLHGGSAEEKLVFWGKKYINHSPSGIPAFSKGFMCWLEDEKRAPYYAKTNGCLMRLSPIPFIERNTSKALQKAKLFTETTHNHPDSVRAVMAYVEIMHSLFKNKPSDELLKIGEKYNYNFNISLDETRNSMDRFYYSCTRTFPPAVICLLNADNYEDAIRNAVSLGGDSDTIACITGGLAEAKFGIPEDIAKQGIKYLNSDFKSILSELYKYNTYDKQLFLIKNKDREYL